MARSKSNSAPGYLNEFFLTGKDKAREQKKRLTRKLFADLSPHAHDFETNQQTREKVKEIITTYYAEILQASSKEDGYVLNLKDIEPAADTLIEEYAKHPLIGTICGMILYGEIRNSKTTQGALLRADDSVAKQWIKGRFMTNKEGNIVPKMETIFRVAFCDMKVLESLESFLGEDIQSGLENTIRGAILVEPNPMDTPIVESATCAELARNACNIVEKTKKRFANEVEPIADAVVKPTADATVIQPKKWSIFSEMFAFVAKLFTENVAAASKESRNRISPKSEVTHSNININPIYSVPEQVGRPIQRSNSSNSIYIYAHSQNTFHNEHRRNTRQETWEIPQPSCPLTDEHGSPLASRFSF